MASKNKPSNPLLSTNSTETGKVISHFRIGMEIGRGSFANVYKGTDLNDNKTVAIKSVFRSRLKNQKLISNLEIEIKILRNLKNPHIVSLLDCIKTDDYFHLVMDYCSLGDLSYFIRKKTQLASHHPLIKNLLENYPSPENSNGLNQIIVINFTKQLASALLFLRSQNLIHRDIKPQNLLLCPPAHSKEQFIDNNYSGFWELPILKVADFGFARYLPSTSMAETLCGSPLYMAPEILRYEKYNAKADLWSVGAVIYEMTVGKPPFRASNHIELLKKIERSNDEINFPSELEISNNLIRLICNLLKANPTDRMGFNEFFNDPIITSNDNINLIHESLSCSVENEEMYISEYLSNCNEANHTKNLVKSYDQKKPLNKTIIEEVDEAIEHEDSTHASNNSIKILKSTTSDAVVTKKNIETKFLPEKNNKKLENILYEQQLKQSSFQNNNTTDDHINTNTNANANTNINLNKKLIKNQKNNSDGSDLIVEKDYVVVEKRNVEVNSFADEISQASKPKNVKNPERRQSFISKQRKYSVSASPSGALKDVLDYTTEKLFGATISNKNNTTSTLKSISNDNLSSKNNLLTRSASNSSAENKVAEKVDINKIILSTTNNKFKSNTANNEIINKIENLAMMAHALSLYADVKFNQVIPLPPSSSNNKNFNNGDSNNNNTSQNENILSEYNSAYKKVCQEGLVLYLKTLSLLSESVKVSSEWWNKNKFQSDITLRMGELIQWIRNRFNESLEKAEYLKLRINKFDEMILKDTSYNDNIIFEKLVFDRAIEISKEAAINELKYSTETLIKTKESNEEQDDSKKGKYSNNIINRLKKCEISYSISVWMLESLLHDNRDNNESTLENEDILIVENFINSIGTRLLILRGKYDNN